jgi:hypothetical protein
VVRTLVARDVGRQRARQNAFSTNSMRSRKRTIARSAAALETRSAFLSLPHPAANAAAPEPAAAARSPLRETIGPGY